MKEEVFAAVENEQERMSELTFTSSLSPEEIEENFRDADVFSGIMGGLQEALGRQRE